MTDSDLFSCAEPDCTKEGKHACSNCGLVSYCKKSCQVAHWPEHKKDCRSPMMKADWHPRWEREDSSPAFASPPLAHNPHNPFGEDKWLWGNVPAVDILKLVDNEGENYSENIAILFAASGDLRNVVKTISQLPDAFTQHLEVTINDQEFHVVARNAIILLFILTMLEDKDAPVGGSKATDSLIHLWYSASLPNGIISDIASRVHPLIIEVCCGVSDMAAEEVVEKTWIFSHGNSLHLSLKKEDWFRMQALCRVPPDLTKDKASKIRTATTLADARRDFRDRWAFKEASPSARVSKQKFREDGLLLPFAHNRAGFDIPNPTFFLRPFSWPLDDKRDPMDGWSIIEVYGVKTVAKEDIYGKLYLYLQSVFRKFLDRLSAANVSFQLLNMNAVKLPEVLQENKYTRIEVSNITDGTYLGTRQTLNIMSQLLQPTHKNSHAIIIASYLNAVMEMVTQGSETDKVPDIDLLVTHFPKLNLLSFLQPESADALRIWDARTVVLDRDKFFERYMRRLKFAQIARDSNVEMKTSNTVVKAWPTKPTLKPGQTGAQVQFDLLLGSNYSCVERFVEWGRTK